MPKIGNCPYYSIMKNTITYKLLAIYVCVLNYPCLSYGVMDESSYIFCTDNDVYVNNIDMGKVSINPNNNSQELTMGGAEVRSIWMYQSTKIEMNSGLVVTLGFLDNSIGFINGGHISILNSGGQGTVNLYGGTIIYLIASEESNVNLYGYDFDIIRYDQPVQGTFPGFGVGGLVTGHWSNNSPFSIEIASGGEVFDHLVFHEIPEPASLLMLGLGALVVGRRAKKNNVFIT